MQYRGLNTDSQGGSIGIMIGLEDRISILRDILKVRELLWLTSVQQSGSVEIGEGLLG